MRDTLTGYVVPGHVGDRAWMAWENYSAVAAVVVTHPPGRPQGKQKLDIKTTIRKHVGLEFAFQTRF